MTRVRTVFMLIALAAAPAGSAAERPTAPAPLVKRLCETLHTLPAARKATCCGTTPGASLTGECTRALGLALSAGSVALEESEVAACASAAAESLSGCDWVRPLAPSVPPACRAVVHGKLAAGAPCASSLECGDGLHCRAAGPTTTGRCAPPAAAGEACTAAVDPLAPLTGQIDFETRHPECNGICRGGRCVAFVALGGVCASNKQCASGLHCASGHCVEGPPPAVGESCAGTMCAGDAACVDGRCVAPKAGGEPCTSPFECRGACLKSNAAPTGTCGMKCESWPPPGYTLPAPSAPAAASSRRP